MMLTRRADNGVWITASMPVGDDTPIAMVIEGERRLMTAVLLHALRGLFRDAESPGRSAARRLQQDMRWLTSAEHGEVFSFMRICDALGLDADRVRQHVLVQLGAATQVLAATSSGARQLRGATDAVFFERVAAD